MSLRHLLQRDALGRGAQVRLVGDALLVERQHVGGAGERVEQADGEVVGVARAQLAELAEVGRRQPASRLSLNCA